MGICFFLILNTPENYMVPTTDIFHSFSSFFQFCSHKTEIGQKMIDFLYNVFK